MADDQDIQVTIQEGQEINVTMEDGAGGLTAEYFIYDETPAGNINGINKLFTTAASYVTGKLRVFLNGHKELNFTEKSSTTFELEDAPLSDSPTPDKVTVSYIKS